MRICCFIDVLNHFKEAHNNYQEIIAMAVLTSSAFHVCSGIPGAKTFYPFQHA